MTAISNDQKIQKEYDFSTGVRGKYTKKYQEGTNVIIIDPDVAEFFSDEGSINDILRSLIPVIKNQEKKIAR
ncbi:MAG: hypothetical protein GY699_16300 [Desulfobacteraceae bacterium]|nr:hypothetical protein [Desulfobacteraceae bacterium]